MADQMAFPGDTVLEPPGHPHPALIASEGDAPSRGDAMALASILGRIPWAAWALCSVAKLPPCASQFCCMDDALWSGVCGVKTGVPVLGLVTGPLIGCSEGAVTLGFSSGEPTGDTFGFSIDPPAQSSES